MKEARPVAEQTAPCKDGQDGHARKQMFTSTCVQAPYVESQSWSDYQQTSVDTDARIDIAENERNETEELPTCTTLSPDLMEP